jgi:hypothetical protein
VSEFWSMSKKYNVSCALQCYSTPILSQKVYLSICKLFNEIKASDTICELFNRCIYNNISEEEIKIETYIKLNSIINDFFKYQNSKTKLDSNAILTNFSDQFQFFFFNRR